jgi:hypothetical protein
MRAVDTVHADRLFCVPRMLADSGGQHHHYQISVDRQNPCVYIQAQCDFKCYFSLTQFFWLGRVQQLLRLLGPAMLSTEVRALLCVSPHSNAVTVYC